MPGIQAVVVFVVVLLVALGTNPGEESFRSFASSRLRDAGGHGPCSQDGVCVYGGNFVRIMEPLNSLSKKVLGYGTAKDRSRFLHFRGTDCVFFTVVHGTHSLPGVYLGILNSWVALPHPKLLVEALPDAQRAIGVAMKTVRTVNTVETIRKPERIFGALYAGMMALQAVSPRFLSNHILLSRSALRMGKMWTLLGSCFCHRGILSALRSLWVLSAYAPVVVRYGNSLLFWGSQFVSFLVAIIVSIARMPDSREVFLGPVASYATLASACTINPLYTARSSPFAGAVVSLRPFDALSACLLYDLLVYSDNREMMSSIAGAVASWLFTRLLF